MAIDCALYERRVLCRTSLSTESASIQRHFTSLVVPGLRVGEFDSASERLWTDLKHRMLAALRKSMRPA